MPDLSAWARDAARLLRPGGHLLVYEANPAVVLLTWDADRPRIREDRGYFASSNVNHTFPARGANNGVEPGAGRDRRGSGRPGDRAHGRVPGTRYPARASRSASVKAGWLVASTVDGAAVVIGHLPAGLEPEGWASPGPSD